MEIYSHISPVAAPSASALWRSIRASVGAKETTSKTAGLVVSILSTEADIVHHSAGAFCVRLKCESNRFAVLFKNVKNLIRIPPIYQSETYANCHRWRNKNELRILNNIKKSMTGQQNNNFLPNFVTAESERNIRMNTNNIVSHWPHATHT